MSTLRVNNLQDAAGTGIGNRNAGWGVTVNQARPQTTAQVSVITLDVGGNLDTAFVNVAIFR